MNAMIQKINSIIAQMNLLNADSAETQTPVELVNEMLDKLPTSLWSDSTKSFLDPACGRGIFGLCILARLFVGLTEQFPDEQERLNHILTNQIFLNDINTLMCKKAEAAFARVIKASSLIKPRINIYNVDILECIFDMKFDVIVGNPPYNKGKMSGASGSGNSIWERFLPRLWGSLKDDGYVCFVHPPEWRTNRNSRSKRTAADLMFNHQILWIKAAFPFPGAGCSVDAYVMQKIPITKPTMWENADGHVYSFVIESQVSYLLNRQDVMTNQILGKILTCDNRHCVFPRKAMSGLVKFDMSKSGSYTFVSGAKFSQKIYEHPHIHQDRMKVIMSDSREFRPFLDEGNLGIGDHVHYALVDSRDAGEWLVNLINSRLSRFLQWAFCEGYNGLLGKHGGEPWNSALPFTMMKLSDEKIVGDSDAYFYNYFNLAQEEITYIESVVK